MGQVLCSPKNGNRFLFFCFFFTNHTGGKILCPLWETGCQTLCRERQLTVCEAGSGALEKEEEGERRGSASDSLRQSMWLSAGRAPLDVRTSCMRQERGRVRRIRYQGWAVCLSPFSFLPLLFLIMTVFKIKESCFLRRISLTKFWRYAAWSPRDSVKLSAELKLKIGCGVLIIIKTWLNWGFPSSLVRLAGHLEPEGSRVSSDSLGICSCLCHQPVRCPWVRLFKSVSSFRKDARGAWEMQCLIKPSQSFGGVVYTVLCLINDF